METKKNIEKAVCEHFKVKLEDIYGRKGKREYPLDGARNCLLWLLYSNGYKSYDIARIFNITDRQVFNIAAKVAVALKSDTKIKEDIKSINQKLNMQ